MIIAILYSAVYYCIYCSDFSSFLFYLSSLAEDVTCWGRELLMKAGSIIVQLLDLSADLRRMAAALAEMPVFIASI